MNTQVALVDLDRLFLCSVNYLYYPMWPGDYMNPPEGPDIILKSVKVEYIRLFDGISIERKWLFDHGWADEIDNYALEQIECDQEIFEQLCEEAMNND